MSVWVLIFRGIRLPPACFEQVIRYLFAAARHSIDDLVFHVAPLHDVRKLPHRFGVSREDAVQIEGLAETCQGLTYVAPVRASDVRLQVFRPPAGAGDTCGIEEHRGA